MRGQGLIIHIRPGVVYYPPWSSTTLGDYTGGTQSEILEIFRYLVREDHPLLLVYHVNEFLFEELNVIVTALVGPSFDGSSQL